MTAAIWILGSLCTMLLFGVMAVLAYMVSVLREGVSVLREGFGLSEDDDDGDGGDELYPAPAVDTAPEVRDEIRLS